MWFSLFLVFSVITSCMAVVPLCCVCGFWRQILVYTLLTSSCNRKITEFIALISSQKCVSSKQMSFWNLGACFWLRKCMSASLLCSQSQWGKWSEYITVYRTSFAFFRAFIIKIFFKISFTLSRLRSDNLSHEPFSNFKVWFFFNI